MRFSRARRPLDQHRLTRKCPDERPGLGAVGTINEGQVKIDMLVQGLGRRRDRTGRLSANELAKQWSARQRRAFGPIRRVKIAPQQEGAEVEQPQREVGPDRPAFEPTHGRTNSGKISLGPLDWSIVPCYTFRKSATVVDLQLTCEGWIVLGILVRRRQTEHGMPSSGSTQPDLDRYHQQWSET